MRISDLNTGLERISHANVDGAFQLPKRQSTHAEYLPQVSPLDTVLGGKSLDRQLVDLLLPPALDGSLLAPPVLAATRKEVMTNFRIRAEAEGTNGSAFAEALKLMRVEDALLSDVQSALAVLLRG